MTQGYRAPTFRSILAGIGLAFVLVLVIGGLPTLVKAVGIPFLVLPSALGITRIPGPSDVQTFNLAGGIGMVAFREPGRYAIYSADWDLLETTDTAFEHRAEPWLKIWSSQGGRPVPVSYVERGIRPYDTPFAPGRPIFTFEIPTWGLYTFAHPGKAAVVGLAPDYATGKEGLLSLLMALQVCALALALAFPVARRWQLRGRETRQRQAERRAQAETLWRPKGPDNRRFR